MIVMRRVVSHYAGVTISVFFLTREITFSSALHLIQNLDRNLELIKSSSFYEQVISVRPTLS